MATLFQSLLYCSFVFLITGLDFTAQLANQKPNILFIISDDHTITSLSCYGNTADRTPNIDKLASEGIEHSWSGRYKSPAPEVHALVEAELKPNGFEMELYNLDLDPLQFNNMVYHLEFRSIVDELQNKLLEKLEEVRQNDLKTICN